MGPTDLSLSLDRTPFPGSDLTNLGPNHQARSRVSWFLLRHSLSQKAKKYLQGAGEAKREGLPRSSSCSNQNPKSSKRFLLLVSSIWKTTHSNRLSLSLSRERAVNSSSRVRLLKRLLFTVPFWKVSSSAASLSRFISSQFDQGF